MIADRLFSPPQEIIEPSRESVFRFLGMKETASPSPRTNRLFSEALKIFRDQVDPEGIIKDISLRQFERVFRGIGENEPDAPLGNIYKRAHHLALVVLTLGHRISKTIESSFASNDFAMASMLDAIASQSAELTSDFAEKTYESFLSSQYQSDFSLKILLYSPGYCGWHIGAQKQLFQSMQPLKIDVELNPQFLMVPLKSISGVLVAGPEDIHRFKNNFSFCRLCMHKSCLSRIKSLTLDQKEETNGSTRPTFPESTGWR